jgi:hypothetical protein
MRHLTTSMRAEVWGHPHVVPLIMIRQLLHERSLQVREHYLAVARKGNAPEEGAFA